MATQYCYYQVGSGTSTRIKKVNFNGVTYRKVNFNNTLFILSTLTGATCQNCTLVGQTKSTRNKYSYMPVYTYRVSEDGTYKTFGGTHTTYTMTTTVSQSITRLVTDDSQFHRTMCFTLIGHPTTQQVATGTETYLKSSQTFTIPNFSATCSDSNFGTALSACQEKINASYPTQSVSGQYTITYYAYNVLHQYVASFTY